MLELKVPISTDDIINAVKKMRKKERETFIESHIASTSHWREDDKEQTTVWRLS